MIRIGTKSSALGARFLTLALTALVFAPAAGAQERPVVLTGATLHPVSGPPIENGVLVLDGASIFAIGDATTTIPAGATKLDLAGKHVYPGFLHPASDIGLVEIDSVRATVDTTEVGENNANIRAEVAFHADSIRLLPALGGGVLFAHVVPSGGHFTGTSAAMRLDGWNWEQMTVKAPVAQHLDFPVVASAGGDDGAGTSKALDAIADILDRARDYRRAVAAGSEVEVDPKLAALVPVLDGERPLWVQARSEDQIRKALEWLEEQELEAAVLRTGYEAVYVADLLAEKQIPVVLGPVLAQPGRDTEPYDFVYSAPARLHEAGVKVVITDGGGSTFARNLPFEVAMAVAYGLPREAGLRSLTLGAAELLGVDDRLGSLEAGKEASFLITDGDPLEITTLIEQVWIEGEEVDLEEDHQRRLWRRYEQRPRVTTP